MTWVRDEAISRSGWCFSKRRGAFSQVVLVGWFPVCVLVSACLFGNPPPDIRQILFSASDIDLAPLKIQHGRNALISLPLMPLYFSNFVVNHLRFEVPFAARGYTAVLRCCQTAGPYVCVKETVGCVCKN